jgi:hypothetical protein
MPISSITDLAGRVMQTVAIAVLAALAFGLLAVSIAASVGFLPWFTFAMTVGDATVLNAGMFSQLIVTAAVFSLLFMAPTNARILKLERSHRDFRISMDDVARAFHACHAADRSGIFTMSSEFDAVRERLMFLRDHPDLGQLETDVMEVAAQMSQQSSQLADTYSDENVTRAKGFLRHRQIEAETQQHRIQQALRACNEIKLWTEQVDIEEEAVAMQLQRLVKTVRNVLPRLGFEVLAKEAVCDMKIVPLGVGQKQLS